MSLVAKGRSVKEAIRIVCVPATNGVKVDSDAGDEWFEKECGKFGESLGNPGQYKADALLYRQILEGRTEFRKKIEEIVEKHKQEREESSRRLALLPFETPHPALAPQGLGPLSPLRRQGHHRFQRRHAMRAWVVATNSERRGTFKVPNHELKDRRYP